MGRGGNGPAPRTERRCTKPRVLRRCPGYSSTLTSQNLGHCCEPAQSLLCSPQHLSRGRTLSSGPVGNGSEYLARLIWGPFKDHPKVPSESPELLLKQQSLPGRGEAVVPETCPNHPARRTNVTGPRELLFLCH